MFILYGTHLIGKLYGSRFRFVSCNINAVRLSNLAVMVFRNEKMAGIPYFLQTSYSNPLWSLVSNPSTYKGLRTLTRKENEQYGSLLFGKPSDNI